MNENDKEVENKDQCNIDGVSKRLKMEQLTDSEKEYFDSCCAVFEQMGVATPNGMILDDIKKKRDE